jgi:hypothetical protein
MSTQEDDVLFVDPISWAYPVGYNANVNNEDGDINNTQTKKVGCTLIYILNFGLIILYIIFLLPYFSLHFYFILLIHF